MPRRMRGPKPSGSFSVAQNGNSLDLVYTLPEPGTLILLTVTVSVLGAGLRRQKKPRVAVPTVSMGAAPANLSFPPLCATQARPRRDAVC